MLEELAPEFGTAKVFRPYRDVRFSHDKTPYKTHQGAVIHPEGRTGAWYVQVSKVFPVRHFADAMKASFFAPTGSGFRGGDLLVIALWGLAGVALAVLFFSWEPRR